MGVYAPLGDEGDAFIAQRRKNCELCGKCHILKGRDAETLYADYIEGRRSYIDITLELRK